MTVQQWAVPVKCTAPGMYMYNGTAELDKYNCTVPKNVQIGLYSVRSCTSQLYSTRLYNTPMYNKTVQAEELQISVQ